MAGSWFTIKGHLYTKTMSKKIYGQTKRTHKLGGNLDDEEFALYQRVKAKTGKSQRELIIVPALKVLRRLDVSADGA